LGVLPHAEGHGHHRRASARARTGLPGSLRGASAQRTCHRWPVAVLWLGYAMLCRAMGLTEEGREGPREIIYEPSSPIPCQQMPACQRAELRTVISGNAMNGVANGLPQRNGHPVRQQRNAQCAPTSGTRGGKQPAQTAGRLPLPLPAAAARCRCCRPWRRLYVRAVQVGGAGQRLARGREPGWDGGPAERVGPSGAQGGGLAARPGPRRKREAGRPLGRRRAGPRGRVNFA
jgi:hypothetical protein